MILPITSKRSRICEHFQRILHQNKDFARWGEGGPPSPTRPILEPFNPQLVINWSRYVHHQVDGMTLRRLVAPAFHSVQTKVHNPGGCEPLREDTEVWKEPFKIYVSPCGN